MLDRWMGSPDNRLMSDPVDELKQKVKWLEQRINELEKDHGTISVYLRSTEPQIKNAILTLVEALARVTHGSPHLSAEEQKKIKQLLGIG